MRAGRSAGRRSGRRRGRNACADGGVGRAEACAVGHQVDGQVAGLQQVAGQFQALRGEPLHGGHADLVAEPPGEGAQAHPGVRGQLAEGDRFGEAFQGPGAGGGGGGERRLGDGAVDVLGLAAVAPGRDHAEPCGPVGDARAVVLTDQVEAEVDAGGHAGRGEDVAVVDEEDLLVEPDAREAPLELGRVQPVRGGGPAVEQSGGGQHVRAGAEETSRVPGRIAARASVSGCGRGRRARARPWRAWA